MACTDQINRFQKTPDTKNGRIAQGDLFKEINSNQENQQPAKTTASPEDTSEIFSYKKESSHFKSELEEKYTNQSDKEDDLDEESDEMILVPYEF